MDELQVIKLNIADAERLIQLAVDREDKDLESTARADLIKWQKKLNEIQNK